MNGHQRFVKELQEPMKLYRQKIEQERQRKKKSGSETDSGASGQYDELGELWKKLFGAEDDA